MDLARRRRKFFRNTVSSNAIFIQKYAFWALLRGQNVAFLLQNLFKTGIFWWSPDDFFNNPPLFQIRDKQGGILKKGGFLTLYTPDLSIFRDLDFPRFSTYVVCCCVQVTECVCKWETVFSKSFSVFFRKTINFRVSNPGWGNRTVPSRHHNVSLDFDKTE